MPSVSNLIFSARRAFCGDKADPADVGRREAALWAEALARAEAVRASHPGNTFVDVEFSAFTRDQIGTIRSIYDQLDLTLSAETEAAMRAWLEAHPHKAATGPKHQPEDFGLTRAGLEAQFADYRTKRGYA